MQTNGDDTHATDSTGDNLPKYGGDTVKSSAKVNDWKELMGKELVLKTIACDDEDAIFVQPQDVVLVDFTGRLANERDDECGPIFQQTTDWMIVVGEKDALPALEMGIRFMRRGETAVVWSQAKFAYGSLTRQHDDYELPPDSNVRYEITVKEIISQEQQDGADFPVELARSRKRMGNDAFSQEWSGGKGAQRARQLYERAARDLEFIVQQSELDDAQKEAQNLLIDCRNNICAVYMKAKDYHKAKEAAVKVLEIDSENGKALLRAARASLMDPASSFEEVALALEAAASKSVDVDSVDLKRLNEDFKRRKLLYERKQKALFSKLSKPDNASTTASTSARPRGSEPADKVGENAVELADVDDIDVDRETDVKKSSADTNWRNWPWRKTILPYCFQLILPLVMLYAYTQMKKGLYGQGAAKLIVSSKKVCFEL